MLRRKSEIHEGDFLQVNGDSSVVVLVPTCWVCMSFFRKITSLINVGLSTFHTWTQLNLTSSAGLGADCRFFDNGDGTVIDTETGLMWKRCPEVIAITYDACDTGTLIKFPWLHALARADKVNALGGFAGYTDWRLPDIKEMASLMELRCYQPVISRRLFPESEGTLEYWTSSPSTEEGYAWAFSLESGCVHKWENAKHCLVRLVRTIN